MSAGITSLPSRPAPLPRLPSAKHPDLVHSTSSLPSPPPTTINPPTTTLTPSYFLEPALDSFAIDADEDDHISYEEVPVEEFEDEEDDDEETLERAVRRLNEGRLFGVATETSPKSEEPPVPKLTKRPEVVDDYVRNWLSSKGLLKSLDAFQNEWYEFQQRGKLSQEDITPVPDVYLRNQELADALQKLRVDVETYKDIASKARSTYDKLRKERDFHRMHHKRVVQEKNRLLNDIKRLKTHYEGYEAMAKSLRGKYESAMKEKMLVRLERERLAGKVTALETQIRQERKTGESPGGSARKSRPDGTKSPQPTSTQKKQTTLPTEDRPNPYATTELPSLKAGGLKQVHVVKAHEMAISSLKFHPKKMILVTVSDDKTWKMWAFPSGELVMSGTGHRDWVSECDFHPKSGTQLATSSGDGTVKIWDFAKGSVVATLNDHTQAVWGCAFHDTGDWLASASGDQTAKLWDLTTARCRQTFRGHADAVNHVGWLPYTNTLYTCSGDKTISLWDARSGLCVQTLYGHSNAVNCAANALNNTHTLTSCDADGTIKLWDLRSASELASADFGPHAANKVAFDGSGSTVVVASNDGMCRAVGVKALVGGGLSGSGAVREWMACEEGCSGVVVDRRGEGVVVGGSDGTFRIFQ
ncbi:WD40-repeat-containing domain protein [Fimicolochytrium jonesii]|uniref:WD40-repeat-containing domain protein n=1 Tax=Fimicolochytrium jonesii TaxID=1396493 RepID=UPI0022FE9B97|nr:WD40-repeat-containing domain protein [Fimicolochytrium jonesii]KAI8825224.1 WD40-repeat-containing domain protein [Fimicolochytrium jonesii]